MSQNTAAWTPQGLVVLQGNRLLYLFSGFDLTAHDRVAVATRLTRGRRHGGCAISAVGEYDSTEDYPNGSRPGHCTLAADYPTGYQFPHHQPGRPAGCRPVNVGQPASYARSVSVWH